MTGNILNLGFAFGVNQYFCVWKSSLQPQNFLGIKHLMHVAISVFGDGDDFLSRSACHKSRKVFVWSEQNLFFL